MSLLYVWFCTGFHSGIKGFGLLSRILFHHLDDIIQQCKNGAWSQENCFQEKKFEVSLWFSGNFSKTMAQNTVDLSILAILSLALYKNFDLIFQAICFTVNFLDSFKLNSNYSQLNCWLHHFIMLLIFTSRLEINWNWRDFDSTFVHLCRKIMNQN